MSISFKFWNLNDRRLSANKFLYTENDLSTLTKVSHNTRNRSKMS
jgi:hypothetical protein